MATTPQSVLNDLVIETPSLVLADGTAIDTLSVDSTALPFVVKGDASLSRVEINVYNDSGYSSTVVIENGTSAGDYRKFSTIVPLDPSVENATVQLVGRNYTPGVEWLPQHAYAVGDRIVVAPATGIDSPSMVFIVTKAGVSGTLEPLWNMQESSETRDSGVTWGNAGAVKVTNIKQFNLMFYTSQNALFIAPPSGVFAYKSQNVCRVEWVQPNYEGVLGVRVLTSTDPTGVNPPYTQYGDLVSVDDVSRTANVVVAEDTKRSSDVTDPNTVTSTTISRVKPVTYNCIDIPYSTVNTSEFYVMVSTIIQDPSTHAVFESQQNGPITCGYIDLKKVNPSDFLALQRKEDIAKRLIAQMTRYYPELDLTPRSELRDLLVDPVALELSNMSVREWFARVSSSISAISQIDDADNDGFSDPFDSSTYKQQIARAYGLNAADTQALIDKQFDILGEQAGVSRLGSRSSVVSLTFYTYTRPAETISIPQGVVVSTIADSDTPSLNFITTASATLDVGSADSFYGPVNGWWKLKVPAQCESTGSYTNVGAGAIRSVVTFIPSGWSCLNLTAAAFGSDTEINSAFASRIANRMVAGIDSGTRRGYLGAALKTPGVIKSKVVAAGDTEMLRDWLPASINPPRVGKHTYGCVDIYTRGSDYSEQTEYRPFQYANAGIYQFYPSYLTLSAPDRNSLKCQINDKLEYPLYSLVELMVSRSGFPSFYLGLEHAQIDNKTGYVILSPDDMAYQYVGDSVTKVKVPYMLNNSEANNKQAVSYASNATYQLFARYQSPLLHTPKYQPVLDISSVEGAPEETGVVSSSLTSIVHTSDFLLYGGSNRAGDEVKVSTTESTPVVKAVTISAAQDTFVDTAIDIPVSSTGVIGDFLSVLSYDKSIAYTQGADYAVVAFPSKDGQYGIHQYGLRPLSVSAPVTSVAISNNTLTLYTKSHFGVGSKVELTRLTGASFLNGEIITVNRSTDEFIQANYSHANYNQASDTGVATATSLQEGQQVWVSYNRFPVHERLILRKESISLSANGTPLVHAGFVNNTWLPESYGRTDLTLDGWNGKYTYDTQNVVTGLDAANSSGLVGAMIPHDSRYIKLTFNGAVMKEGVDYSFVMDSATGQVTLSRILSGHISEEGASVEVTYFTTEEFTIKTQYPAFVEVLASQIEGTKHAAADVLVKSMLPNPVDITMTVVVDPNVPPETVDPTIRTAIGRVLDNSNGKLVQSKLVQQVQSITGIQRVQLPLAKCAKSDGAYNVGYVIPTNTEWLPLRLNSEDWGRIGSQRQAMYTKQSDSSYVLTLFNGKSIPNYSYISATQILPDATLPSGGQPLAFVGLLYQGEGYTRRVSLEDFLNNSTNENSFYIIGTNDAVDNSNSRRVLLTSATVSPNGVRNTVVAPGKRSYFVTYQVWGADGSNDIMISSTEYLTAGRITLNYVIGN